MKTARVAVIGSGPAGLYAADALVRSEDVRVEVDVIERLPTPYGLVRYGVAPDHPRIKSTIVALQKVLEHDRVRFLGNVDVGSDIQAEELAALYDAVLWATGAPRDRRMGIPGEDLRGSCSATEFVAWYSGHPDSAFSLELDPPGAAVIGAGNVALDVARLLVKTEHELAETDMPPQVLRRLAASAIRDVHLVCRRGPQHAKFTSKELREFLGLQNADVIIDPLDMDLPDGVELPSPVQANLRVLRELAERPVSGAERRVHFHFWKRPIRIDGEERIAALQLEGTQEMDGVVNGTGVTETLPVGLVFRSIGYRSVAVPSVPFDEVRALIPNDGGRIIDASGQSRPGWYVAGWAKRGPSGVIGTNRACAAETAANLIRDLAATTSSVAHSAAEVDQTLHPRGVRPVNYDGWLCIDAGEIGRGRATGRPRTKIPDWETLRQLGCSS